MNEIIQNLEVNATNGEENFCYISENKLNALKELSKREYEELKKKDEVIENITNSIKNDIDGFITINDHGECNDILELLEIYLDILEDKEVE